MDLEALTCAVCYEKYDHTEHTPRILPACGHTFCSYCLSKILLDFDAKCPLDKKDIYGDTIDDFPVNYAVRQMIEGKTSKGLCKEHRQEMLFACFTDKCMICPECIWRNNHQTHSIKTLNAIREETLSPRKELETFLEDVEKCSKDVKDAIEEERFMYLNTIKKRFKEIRSILEKKEFSLNFEVNLLFDAQIKKIDAMIGKDSTWKNEIVKKISDLKDVFLHEEFLRGDSFFEEIREYTDKCKSKINFGLAKQETELIRYGTKERSKSFTNAVKKQFRFLSNLDFPMIDSLEGFMKVFSQEEDLNGFHIEPTAKRNYFKTFSSIIMQDNGTFLNIAAANQLSPTVSPQKPQELDESISSQTEQGPRREGLQVLNHIWKRVKQASEIILRLNPSNISDKIFPSLMADPGSFSAVEINLEGISQSDIPSKEEKSIGKMLSKIVTLEKICLVLNKIWLSSDSSHRAFTKEILHSKRLTDLTLELSQAYMQEDIISDLSAQMPALENLHLDLSETNIKDKDLRLFSRTTLHSAEALENFHLSLFCTQITDTGLRSFSLNSTMLKKFFLDIGITKITDRSLHCLSKVLENSLGSLESFTLSMGSNKITDEGICKLFRSMPKVKTFFLGLFDTYITDETVEAFVNNTLVSMENLEELTLWFQETKLTDYSVARIASKLKPVRKLSLNFSSTQITDESIQMLVRKVLPEMTGLKELELEVGNTDVTHQMLCEISSFQENLVKSYRKDS